jgi:hypothetical protein
MVVHHRRLMQAALVMVVMSAVVFAGIYVIGDRWR